MSSYKSTFFVVVLLLAGVLGSHTRAQSHFQTVWSGSPFQGMNIYVTAISLTGPPLSLVSGDEIAVFDGSICVGAAVISVPIGSFVSIIASSDDPSTGTVDGFISGHTISYKYWKQSYNKEDGPSAPVASYSMGDGTFAPLGTAVLTLEFFNLPVQLSSFTASRVSGSQITLRWTTLSETNNYGFEVEKSVNQPDAFTRIPNSFVSGHGTVLVPQDYAFTDDNVSAGVLYYRLVQIDLDGTAHRSDAVKVELTTSTPEGTVPGELQLLQNYPNPFNPSTEVKFSVEKTGQTTVKVYDLLGREVATLFNGVAEAGRYHVVTFSASPNASGTFYLRLETDHQSMVRRMLLVR